MSSPPSGAASARGGDGSRSFSLGATADARRKVFAHYFPPYPISIDNKPPFRDYYARNYLDPDGEGGRHAAYGGLLRDRPLGRPPRTGAWRSADLETEVRQAADAGIDGFTVDILGFSGQNWETVRLLVEAAESAGVPFSVVPNLDVSASAGSASPSFAAAKLAELYRSSSAYRLEDGRRVLSSFKAEGKDTRWWSAVQDDLEREHGIRTALIAVLLDPSDANLRSFAAISYAVSIWGPRSNDPTALRWAASRARELGVRWMAPVAVQDVRHSGRDYAEAGNTETLRGMWRVALESEADLVQMATWNDYSESTAFAPSVNHGRSFLDINAYFLSQFKTGLAPTVVSDSLYVVHRTQPFDAVPRRRDEQPMVPDLGGSTTPPRDTVEVVSFLTQSATIHLTVGPRAYSAVAPAGFSALTFPLVTGVVSARAVRGSTTVCAVRSPFVVEAHPEVTNLEYVAVNSLGR